MNRISQSLPPFMLLLAVGMLFFSCKRTEQPPVETARQIVFEHFNHPVYQNLVEVEEVTYANHFFDKFNENDYVDMLMDVRINVLKSHVLSKHFTYSTLDVNEEWPAERERQLAEAADEESRLEIIDAFERNTFSEGQHEIRASINLGNLNNRWLLLGFTLYVATDNQEIPSGNVAE
ncbi:MAG: hypothetical protein RG741_08285 [Bacteroidales bacterium]|nr:hypothetical protein [Bacteroidales bacterium]